MAPCFRITLNLLGLIGVLTLASFECNKTRSAPLPDLPASVPISEPNSVTVARNSQWQTEKWTGSDQPFLKVQQQIERSLAQGISLTTLLDNYRAQAVANPTNAALQYGWCYLALKSVNAVQPNGRDLVYIERINKLNHAVLGMIYSKQPHDYLYSHLLFLARLTANTSEDFALIGERLLTHNPDDDAVREQMVYVYKNYYPPKTQKALDNAHYLFRKDPNSPKLYYLLADIYFGEFSTHKQPEMADKAIASWHKAFQLEPPDASESRLIQSNIKYIYKLEGKT